MTPVELLAELARLRVDVLTGPDGRPRLDGMLTDELAAVAVDTAGCSPGDFGAR